MHTARVLVSRHGALRGPFCRFLATGVVSTVLTGLLIVIIARWVNIEIAYTIVFTIGLMFTTAAMGLFVFRSRLTHRRIRRFVSWYLCVYLLGLTVTHLAGHQWHISHILTAVAVLAVTAPLNFLGGTRAFLMRSTQPPPSR
jgi:putative flippase GtrA